MLLFTCRICLFQEWQNSIQKNAGLAFIELINEGRWRLLYSHNQYFSLFLGFFSTKTSILYSSQKPVGWLKITSKPLVGCYVDITENNIAAIICNISVVSLFHLLLFLQGSCQSLGVVRLVVIFSQSRSAAEPTGPSANPSGHPFSLAMA